jgi:hypothetical protein
MKVVLQMFWRICLLRQSPAYVPTEGWFVAVVVVANLLISILVSVSIDRDIDPLIVTTRIVVSQATYACLVWLAAYLREHPGRFIGTLTALFGCDAIITATFGVLVPMATALDTRVLNVLSVGCLVWSLAVAGYILAQALSVRLGIGVLLALGILVLTVATGNTAIGV